MDKINFENLPSTKTPINNKNLNTIQNNVEKEINSLNIILDSINTTLKPIDENYVYVNEQQNIVDKNNNIKNPKIDRYEVTELWTNDSPNTEFQAQTIPLDLTDYKYIEILFFRGNTVHQISSIKGMVGQSVRLLSGDVHLSSNNIELAVRDITINTSNISFSTGYLYNQGTSMEHKGVCIPYIILGYKKSE